MSCLKLLNRQSSIRPLRSQYKELDLIMSENKKSPQIVATFAGKKSLKHFLIKANIVVSILHKNVTI